MTSLPFARDVKGATRLSDAVWLALVLSATTLFAWRFVDFGLAPSEDAAMLMRYARHFAAGHGIVWNIGEPPLDGATDFLFVIAVGLVHRAGVSLEGSVLALTVASHFAMVALVYLGVRRQQAGVFAAAATALYVAVGPGLPISAAYFGATFFALALTVAWLLGLRLVLDGRRGWRACSAFAAAALVAALVRPEGALMAGFMTLGLALALPAADAFRLLASCAAVFLPLGGMYFGWRWHYFGHPLPNPFYRKGGWQLHRDGLDESVTNVVYLCFPFLLAYEAALVSSRLLRLSVALAIPLVGFTLMWWLLSPETNFAARFQYPVLPIAALSWYPLARALPQELRLSPQWTENPWLHGAVAFICVAVVAAVLAFRLDASARITRVRQGNYEMGVLLQRYADRGYTLATTEAGLLPLYSQWRALDTWGLNDAWIARHGSLTEDYLSTWRPSVVMWHDYFSPLSKPQAGREGPWVSMVQTLQHFVRDRGYVLAAAFGRSPEQAHYYWVAADLPDCAEIVERIRGLEYAWPNGGAPALNLAAIARQESPSCAAAR